MQTLFPSGWKTFSLFQSSYFRKICDDFLKFSYFRVVFFDSILAYVCMTDTIKPQNGKASPAVFTVNPKLKKRISRKKCTDLGLWGPDPGPGPGPRPGPPWAPLLGAPGGPPGGPKMARKWPKLAKIRDLPL